MTFNIDHYPIQRSCKVPNFFMILTFDIHAIHVYIAGFSGGAFGLVAPAYTSEISETSIR